MSEDRLIDIIRTVAAAYRDGLTEGRRQTETALEMARERIAELEAQLRRARGAA